MDPDVLNAHRSGLTVIVMPQRNRTFGNPVKHMASKMNITHQHIVAISSYMNRPSKLAQANSEICHHMGFHLPNVSTRIMQEL